ncbi:MAG TPA: tail fiber domain-containing protein [Chitinophagaceae bacterium]|nr:tail fiber domain-containing protein [Chitinophagaceae bacterium]
MKKLFVLPLALGVSCAALKAQSWNLAGNAGTNPSTHFVGTTDNQPLRFRINNAYAGLLHNDNTFFGRSAGLSHTTGFGNTANGVEALRVNTTSNYNTALGWRSLYSNTSGYSNTATGGAAMIMNTTGHNNTATGYYSLGDNRTGNYNSAFGLQALGFSNSGNTNTAVGAFAAGNNSSGNSNVAVGVYALSWTTNRSNLVAVGDSALYWNGYPFPSPPSGITATGNTAVGSKALYNNTTGYLNTAFGYRALYSNTSGNSNTAVGYNAYPISGTLSNYTGIGYNVGTSSSVSNSVEIGNSSVTWIGGQVGWSTYSDERIKENIQEDVQGLSFITKLRPVTYSLNIHKQRDMTQSGKQKDEVDWPEKYAIEKKKITGFLAQEVEQAAKACNYDFHGITRPSKAEGLYSLSYGDFVVPLVKAVQEQQSMIEKLQKKIEELEKKVAACAPVNY